VRNRSARADSSSSEGVNPMPIVMPPMLLDVPAIIQPVSHFASGPTSIQSRPVTRPAASSEHPFIVFPPPVTVPSQAAGPSGSTGTTTHKSGR
jgi:hypothetical protein